VDIWTYIGTLGIFTSLFLLFIRFLPMIAMSEVKTAVPEADPHYATPTGIQRVSPGAKERTR
jgi:molybdopterin-containing oxidoreductase family membrane subunit